MHIRGLFKAMCHAVQSIECCQKKTSPIHEKFATKLRKCASSGSTVIFVRGVDGLTLRFHRPPRATSLLSCHKTGEWVCNSNKFSGTTFVFFLFYSKKKKYQQRRSSTALLIWPRGHSEFNSEAVPRKNGRPIITSWNFR